jgi:hypothetical protein
MDELWVYDNSKVGGPPQMVMEAKAGGMVFLKDPPPTWLAATFGWKEPHTCCQRYCRPETGGQNQQF